LNTPRRLITSAAAAAFIALAAVPAVASATTTAGPGQLTFPERQVLTQSDPQTVTVVVQCTGIVMANCVLNDTFTYNPQFSGANPEDFSATNLNCPPAMQNNNLSPGVCQFAVRFKPTATGTRNAVLTAGTATTNNPNPIQVTGTAVPSGQRAAALAKCKKKKTKKKRKKCKRAANLLPE
jgi:hypothetical protein